MPVRDHNKKLAFVLVLSAHVAVLYLVERSLRLQHPARAGAEPPPLSVTFLDLTSPPVPAPGPPPSTRGRERVHAAPPQAPPAEAAAAPAPSTAITDWHELGQAAAGDIAAGGDRPQHPFGHEFGPAPGKPDPGVFGPKNEHPAGTVEKFDEVERHWVTGNCFFDIDRYTQLMAGPKVMTLTCKPPVTGGDDMFKKLRPGYLTPPPAAGDEH